MVLDAEPALLPKRAERWSFLDTEADPLCVLTRRMNIVYLNPAARGVVPPDWFGHKCWDVFPVPDRTCGARCPAVKAINKQMAPLYCEETIFPGGTALHLGIVVTPLAPVEGEEQEALLVLWPKPVDADEEKFKRDIHARAETLHALAQARLA